MLLPFKFGLGGRIGSGDQWMSWIGLSDWVRAASFLLHTDAVQGPVNLVAPNPMPNGEFTKTLARVLGRPTLGFVPAAAVDLFFGEMGRATLLASQRVRPRRLVAAGFEFTQPTLEQTLRAELATSQ
jgi:NAD dependent epimerase/dehydratase family enzyme